MHRHQHTQIARFVGNVIFLLGVHVLGGRAAVLQQRQGAQKIAAPAERVKHRPPLTVKAQAVVQLHPTREPAVVAPLEVDAAALGCPGDRFPARGVPDGGIGHADDMGTRQPRVLPLHPRDLGENALGAPPHPHVGLARGAPVEFEDAVKPPVAVLYPPPHRKGFGVAEVKRAVALPVRGGRKGLDHVGAQAVGVMRGTVGELLEHLPLVHVPVALEVRPPLMLRQGFQAADVVGVGGHQHLVVVHAGGDKAVVLGALSLAVDAIDEKPLDVGVAHPAGVAGVINAGAEIGFGRAQ